MSLNRTFRHRMASMKFLMARCGRQMIASKSPRNGSGTLNEFETKLRLTLHFNDIANVRLAVLCPEISAVYVASKHDGATHDDGIQNFSLRNSAGLHCYQFWPDRYAAGFVAGNRCSRWFHRFGCCHEAGQAPLHGNLSQLHQPPTSTFGFDTTTPPSRMIFLLSSGCHQSAGRRFQYQLPVSPPGECSGLHAVRPAVQVVPVASLACPFSKLPVQCEKAQENETV